MKRKIVNIMGFFIPIVLFFVLFGSFVKSIKRAKETERLIQKTKNRVEKQEEENKRLQNELEFVKSDKFLEEQLRNKLGLAKEGEIVLVLPDDETLEKIASDIPEEEEMKPLPNWKVWLDLFL